MSLLIFQDVGMNLRNILLHTVIGQIHCRLLAISIVLTMFIDQSANQDENDSESLGEDIIHIQTLDFLLMLQKMRGYKCYEGNP